MASKNSSDSRKSGADSKPAKGKGELGSKDLDKVTGGLTTSKIVKSADPCEGGR